VFHLPGISIGVQRYPVRHRIDHHGGAGRPPVSSHRVEKTYYRCRNAAIHHS
jgi:hypothetical protein